MSQSSLGFRRWGLLGVSLAAGVLLSAALLALLPAGEAEAKELSVQSAHVVVQFVDGNSAVRPVTWTGTISRVAALQAAGFAVESSGDYVCAIEGEGCPATNCWCPDNYWGQGQWGGGAWDTSAFPIPPVADGDVIAFRNAKGMDDWGLTGLLPGAPTYVAASDALEWMRGQQQADGSYVDAAGAIGASTRALLVLGAAGYDPDAWGSPSLLSFMTVISRTETADYAAAGAAEAGKLALGAAWTGQDVRDFAGVDLPVAVSGYFSATTGGYGDGSGDTVWAVLGLAAMGEPIPVEAAAFLKSVQNADGGWAWNEWGTSSESQHTAQVVQALLAAGESAASPEIASALAFIASAKNADSGYAYLVPGPSDVGSTAAVVQGQLSTGHRSGGNWCSVVDLHYLLNVQLPDGSYPGLLSGLYSTQEAIPALMHRPLGPPADYTYNCFGLYLPGVWAGD